MGEMMEKLMLDWERFELLPKGENFDLHSLLRKLMIGSFVVPIIEQISKRNYFADKILFKLKANPDIRKHLLWEYNWEEIDFVELATVVVERVIERGDIQDWKEMIRFYGKSKIREIARQSTRLDRKNKQFTNIFLQSKFVD